MKLTNKDKVDILHRLRSKIENNRAPGMCSFLREGGFKTIEVKYVDSLLKEKAKRVRSGYFDRTDDSRREHLRSIDIEDLGAYLWKPFNKNVRIKWINSHIAELDPNFNF